MEENAGKGGEKKQGFLEQQGNVNDTKQQNLEQSNPIALSTKKFGHTFEHHGEDKTVFLTHRALAQKRAQGQFLDNQVAAKFILDNLDKLKHGAVSVEIPIGFPARMINPDGTYGTPTKIRLVPGGQGVKTSYPEY